MKQIIDSKRYATESAVRVASWDNGLSCTDFNHVKETLYVTKSGAWFLHGAGGAFSRWSQPCGDGRGGGESIMPLTTDEAREWLEAHKEIDPLEKYFAGEITDA